MRRRWSKRLKQHGLLIAVLIGVILAGTAALSVHDHHDRLPSWTTQTELVYRLITWSVVFLVWYVTVWLIWLAAGRRVLKKLWLLEAEESLASATEHVGRSSAELAEVRAAQTLLMEHWLELEARVTSLEKTGHRRDAGGLHG